MRGTNLFPAGLLCFAMLLSPLAQAQVDALQAARLDQDLTPLGAERAGNAEGTIPAWEGGLRRQADAQDLERGYKDPFAADQILFTITAANAEQYRDRLSPGQLALLKRYPDSWKMQVYPTRRSASYSEQVYAAIKANALNAHLVEDGYGIAGTKNVVPFPIPGSALELVWNHLMRYRGVGVTRYSAGATPLANGSYQLSKMMDTALFNQDVSDYSKDNGNILVYYRQSALAPARGAGQETLVHEPVNQVKTPRLAWIYNAGQRRVRRAPNFAYDDPASNGMATNDNGDMFSGAPDRYDWQLVGKQEMYVPYNNYRFASKTNKYSDIIMPGHINSDLPRYELHRVWHVRGVLKAGIRHVYKQRDLYLDEDSYQILVSDHRDNRDVLWRVGEAYTINFYDQPLVWTVGNSLYDLTSGRYTISILTNEEVPYDFNVPLTPADFTPAKLRQGGVR
ncbi:hypothetical protein FIV02_13615 [Pseudomonas sp. THAF187a]|uniref:DUF1329 domain-containing protein n=1 Tax=unclassified Pseudomonas TaxID=196821 RepID=UPI001268407B|nr:MULTISPECIES: DUF1329 domain-containing protein [unclassified Pseudomonas]QFT22613.1 hypothetical protein FIV02_13615 [Pseudomonas sp. THAF187a]QFT42800.1 hypothetical protein FIU98_13595 [Pseudomonas sp. THAF42]